MANLSKTPEAKAADSPYVANLKFKERQLVEKLKQIDGMKPEQGFDYAAAKSRNEALLAEVRKAIKDTK